MLPDKGLAIFGQSDNRPVLLPARLINLNVMKKFFAAFLLVCLCEGISAQETTRWIMSPGGLQNWIVDKNEKHTDHIEMSGRQVSVIVTYGSDHGMPVFNKRVVFPMLRTIPNDTRGNVIHDFGPEIQPVITVNSEEVQESIDNFSIRGALISSGSIGNGLNLSRIIFPSMDHPAVIELVTINNGSGTAADIHIGELEHTILTPEEKGVDGIYRLTARGTFSGDVRLDAGEELSFAVVYSGGRLGDPDIELDWATELAHRENFISEMFDRVRFVSPDPVLDRMFDFAKIRAMESIFETRNGLVHSPGGSNYYAAIWANDQAEYANPFFAITGYDMAVESAMTSWEWFAKYMNPEYVPIPSSIIAEGTDYWNGAGDRGDMAMIAYGAGRFALALGDREAAERIWPLIEWCLEYCRRQINGNGVVASDSDELENRFPSGDANLCTSALYYDALLSAVYLGRDLDKDDALINSYELQAAEIRENIERFFGAKVQGFDTYRYYEDNDILRSWICIPLTVDILDRAESTLDALFSPLLWTENGLLTEQGSHTFWDRSTLYGLRGAFAAGDTDRGLPYLQYFSRRRLLGDHVPYAVEAWPEGDQRHLSAESALYCRTITEGLFGMRPTGLRTLRLTPRLPDGWERMELLNITAFGHCFDITVTGEHGRIHTYIDAGVNGNTMMISDHGESIEIDFSMFE